MTKIGCGREWCCMKKKSNGGAVRIKGKREERVVAKSHFTWDYNTHSL